MISKLRAIRSFSNNLSENQVVLKGRKDKFNGITIDENDFLDAFKGEVLRF